MPKKKSSIPALPPDTMGQAMAKLAGLPLNKKAKERMALMLLEAARGSARHSPERTDSTRQQDRQAVAAAVRLHFDSVIERAVKGLESISDAEWDQMVQEAEEDLQ